MTTVAALPPLHAPFVGGDAPTLHRELRHIIEDAIVNQPRSLQKRIGPSEIGTPCDHCLAAKLAGWQTAEGVGWLPFIGTCVHAWLEELFVQRENAANTVHTTGRRFLAEQTVMVGHIGGEEIWGSTDLFDTATGTTVDWKVVGATRLRSAKAGPEPTYRVQAHLYGRGWINAGYRVEHVSIVYLPRNSINGWDDAVLWHEPYDEQVATTALDRANRIAANLAALAALGPDAVSAWIGGLPRAPRCHDCPRFPDGKHLTPPGHRPRGTDFADLLGSAAA